MIIDFRNFGNFANMIHKKRIRIGGGGFLLKSPETISKINEVQLGLIATASLVVIRRSQTGQESGPVFLFSLERNGTISYHFCLQGTERYHI